MIKKYVESKIIKYGDTNTFGVFNLPFKINNKFHFVINTSKQNFSILFTSRLFDFWIDYKTNQVELRSIDSNVRETLM